MTTKYLYVYLIVGIVLLGLGISRLVADKGFSATVLGDIIPACLLFYLAYKAYKNKQDQELM